jgi:uncharacterized RDD family membrane protein YckC
MRVGLFKRSASFLLDIMPIIMIVMLLQQWFIAGIIKNSIDPNYNQLEVEYFELLEQRDAEIEPYYQQYEDGDITVEQFEAFRDPINNAFLEDNTDLINTVIIQYWLYAIMYWIISTNLIYMIYVLAFKGQTLGRKVMKIKLVGNVKWYSLILREILWKTLFYVITFSAGVAIDIGLIAFTKKKRTLRDMFSKTYLAFEGVDYPF